MIASGQLTKRVTLKSVATAPSATTGAPSNAETTVATVWAAIEPLQGRELAEAQSRHTEVEVRIRIRYRPGVIAALRAYYGARRYDIKGVIDPLERHEELHLLCKEYTDGR